MQRMMSFKYFPLLILTWILLYQSSSATTNISNVGDAFSIALKNNSDLKAFQSKNKVSAIDARISQSALYPNINFSTDLNYNFDLPTQLIPAKVFGGKDGEYKALSFGTDYSMNAFIDANMPLLNTTIWSNIKQAKLLTKQTALRIKLKEIEIKKNVGLVYYGVLLSKANKNIAEKMLAISDTLYQSTKLKFEAGLLDKIEQNRIENTYLQSKNALETATAQENIKTQELKMYLGLSPKEDLNLSELLADITNPVSESMSIKEVSSSLEYKIKQIEIKNSLLQLSKEQLKTLPEISAFMKYGKQSFSNQFSNFNDNNNWYNNGIVGIKLNIPLFKGFSRSNEIMKAKQLNEIAKQESVWLQSKISKDDYELTENFSHAYAQLENSRKAYDLANESYSLSSAKFLNGIINTDAVMNIYRETLNAQSDYIRTLNNYLLTKISIQLRNEMESNQ
jgi:outer membrane protein TolC